nr:ParB/RepB/Spo0J family partition protein [Nitrosomonas nitrosa]
MSKRSEEQLRRKDELRRQREEREARSSQATSSSETDREARAFEGSGTDPASGTAAPSPAPSEHQTVGDMRTAGAAPRRMMEGLEKGLAAKLEEKSLEAARLAALVDELMNRGVEWKILPVDPALIDVVGFNRFQSTFDPQQDRAFADLLANIQAVGGNKQPGMVRPSPATEGRYELVFGERRLRACEQAALPFSAIVADLGDDDVWLFRESENFGRKDKGILEQALALVDMPTRFAYGERSAILDKLKISKTHYLRLRAIAGVPKAIWEALPGAHSTTAREAAQVVDAYRDDPRAVKSRVPRIRPDMRRSDAVRFLATGTLTEVDVPPSPDFEIIRKGSSLSIKLRSTSDEAAEDLEGQLRQWLQRRGLHATDS